MKFNRKFIKKVILLSMCLAVSTIAVSALRRYVQPPSQPGRPEAYNITEDRCDLIYLEPISDGGAPITNYFIEKRSEWNIRWKRIGTTPYLTFRVSNVASGTIAQFRVLAKNLAGLSEPSKASDFITFQDPFSK